MPEQRYRIVFVGLCDDLPGTKKKFRENVSKIFKIDAAQIDRLLAKTPVILKGDLTKEKADSIANKMTLAGGRVSIESDKSGTIQSQKTVSAKKPQAKFNLYINQTDSEESKRRIASYLNGIMDIDYMTVRNEILRRIPAALPGEYNHEEALEIRRNLEEFGSKVLIIETKMDSRIPDRTASKIDKRSLAMVGSILVVLFLAFLFMINNHQYERRDLETENSKIENEVANVGGEKTKNTTQLRLAKEAVEALLRVEARCQPDISYTAYLQEFENAKSQVTLFLESQETQNRFLLVNSINNVLVHYKNVTAVWGYKINNNTSYLSQKASATQSLLEIYPSAAKPRETGGASGSIDTPNDVLWIDPLLSIIMAQASKELKRASRVLGVKSPVS